MNIERLITTFDNETEALTDEVSIDYVELDQLRRIFNVPADDPLMYNIYEIKLDHVQAVNKLLKDKIEFDLKKNAYYVECVQLPPYDFATTTTDVRL